MKERGILMNGDMVRATLREVDPKWQTRRIVKQPNRKDGAKIDMELLRRIGVGAACPFGAPGDRLWVREAFALIVPDDKDPCERWVAFRWSDTQVMVDCASDTSALKPIRTREAKHKGTWTPGIYMPRWASRITLEITNVRVERLQDISEDDAKAEGVELLKPNFYRAYNCKEGFCTTARQSYEMLWESINGPGSWTANPWVWVIEFRRIKP